MQWSWCGLQFGVGLFSMWIARQNGWYVQPQEVTSMSLIERENPKIGPGDVYNVPGT